jgi:superfamily II DNA or RNA helicase
VNIPSLDCVIFASGGKSDIATLQGIGRGLRTTDEKKTFVIVDFLDPYRFLAQHTIQRLRIYVENNCL